MSRASRRAKSEGELEHLEARFRERLVAALHACRDGRSGLFGQGDPGAQRALDRVAASRTIPADVAALLALGDEIDALRSSLGFPGGNTLYARLRSYRRLRIESAPGEPRLAQQFLAELESQDTGVHETP
jgi:hypothetical protein